MDPIISVIIPVYNVEPYIRQCFDSIINQTYRNLEIIVIDDGSPDGCGKICDEYAAKDDRMVVIHKENGGLSAARNDGIKLATGDWIAFVDSDDWCEVDYYDQFIKAIDNTQPDVLQAGGFLYEYPRNSKVEYYFTEAFQENNDKKIKALLSNLAKIGLPWDKLYRADFLRENQIKFDVRIKAWEDHLFNFRVFCCAKNVACAVFAGYHYRQTNTSISKGYNPNKPQFTYDYITKLHSLMDKQDMSEEVRSSAYTDTIVSIIMSLKCYYFHPMTKKSRREISNEIKAMKKRPYNYEAIRYGGKLYLTKKQKVVKYALMLPWIEPLRLMYSMDIWSKKQ